MKIHKMQQSKNLLLHLKSPLIITSQSLCDDVCDDEYDSILESSPTDWFSFSSMTQMDINNAISAAFANLSNLNEQVYDYWVTELYTDDGEMIDEMWNEQTLCEMEKDVMYNF
jgi:hypothetical protein